MKSLERKSKYTVFVIILLIIAFIIRFLFTDRPFCGNDMAMFQQFSIDSVPIKGFDSFFSFDNYGIGNPLRVFALLYSITYPIFWLVVMSFYEITGIGITELAWRVPLMLISLLTILVIYFFLQKFLTKKQSLIATAFFVILPAHITWSRSVSNIMMFSLSIQLCAIYFFMTYFETNKKKYGLLSSLFIALFILTDNFFPQFLVIIGFIFLIYNYRNFKSIKSLKTSLMKILNWRVCLLPFLALCLQFLIFLVGKLINSPEVGSDFGMIGHILAKPKYFGSHLFPLSKAFYSLTNPVICGFILVMIILGLRSLIKLRKESVLLFAGMIYSLPFAFFMNPNTVNVRIYIFPSLVFLLMFSFTMLFKIKFKSSFRNIFLICLFLITGLFVPLKIYGIPESNVNFTGYGSNLRDCGIKAVGYWFRTNTDLDAKIMPKYESTRIGQINGKYYLHRSIYGVFYPPNWDDFFEAHLDDVDYIVLGPEDKHYIERTKAAGFNLTYRLIYKNEKTFLIFTKSESDPQEVDISTYSDLYRKTFNKISDYTGAPNYVADSPAWV